VATSTEGFGGRRAGTTPRSPGVSNPALLLLIWLLGASGFLLLLWGSKLTFLLDDWEFLLYRRGFNAHAILDPHGEHISIAPVLIYKALLATFGMGSALPFRVVSTGLFLLSAVLLFVYLQRRVGQWLALAGTAVVLFLGAAWEDLLWSFQIGYFGSMAAGLGALLAFERVDRRRDILGCLLLTVSVVFSSLGLPFLAGAAVQILRRSDRWKRAYVVAIPIAAYALWWLGWGHTAESALSLANVAKTPSFVLNGLAASLASTFGLATPPTASVAGGLDWGRPLAVAAILLVLWRLRVPSRVPGWFWVALAIGGAFWILAGLNQIPGRDPTASRYQYVGVVLALLVAAELLRGVEIGPRALAAILVVAAASIASNVYYLHQAYGSYHYTSQLEKADLGAVEIARDSVEPSFVLSEDLADTAYVHVEAGPYLSASDEFGSPAYAPAELAEAPGFARFAADKVLSGALELGLDPVPGSALPGGSRRSAKTNAEGVVEVPASGCVALPGDFWPLLSLPPGGVFVRAQRASIEDFRLRRFATEGFPIDFQQGLGAEEAGEVQIPTDRSKVPWRMEIDGAGPAIVCGTVGGG
jgi:hypothetical protein